MFHCERIIFSVPRFLINFPIKSYWHANKSIILAQVIASINRIVRVNHAAFHTPEHTLHIFYILHSTFHNEYASALPIGSIGHKQKQCHLNSIEMISTIACKHLKSDDDHINTWRFPSLSTLLMCSNTYFMNNNNTKRI